MRTFLYMDDIIFRYGFPDHPLSNRRYEIFRRLLDESELLSSDDLVILKSEVPGADLLLLFHDKSYVDRVRRMSDKGAGFLDYGDTPVFKGVYEVASACVYATVDAFKNVYMGDCKFAIQLCGGWHHSRRNSAGGFCVFNDIGVAIEYLRKLYGGDIKFYYIDIDAHHGDGVYYSYESDPYVYIFDIHESGRYLYPGTGFEYEIGVGEGRGTKRNVPLSPHSGDSDLLSYIDEAYKFGVQVKPDIIVLQGGLDGLEGDPLTHLNYSVDGYIRAVEKIIDLSLDLGVGLVFLGGGGYQPELVAEAWLRILGVMVNI